MPAVTRSATLCRLFEKFTERARRAIVLAQEESRALGHDFIGTEHILLGLLREEDGLAARVLGSLNVTLERVRAQVVQVVARGEGPSGGQIPFTPRAKQVLELALREALSLGHNYIGTEHILLGLVRESNGVAGRILLEMGAGPEEVRSELIPLLPVLPGIRRRPANVMPATGPQAGRIVDMAWLEGLAPVLDQLAGEIRSQLGREPDAGDLLLALGCAHETLPARALGELGVDLDVLGRAIEHAREQAARVQAEESRAREQLTQEILRRLGIPPAGRPPPPSEAS